MRESRPRNGAGASVGRIGSTKGRRMASVDQDWTKPAAMAIPKEGYFELERGRFDPVFPRTPACHGFSIIAKVKEGREEAIRAYGKTIEETIAASPEALAPLRLHYLAAMPYIEDSITTNWDTYFEEKCAATPFVTGNDIALWKTTGRRVLTIHGSMANLGSITATETDYKRSLKSLRKSVLGGLLTELSATRILVFVGYSLKDWNFRRLYRALLKDMGQYSKQSYLVSPFDSDEGMLHRRSGLWSSGKRYGWQNRSRIQCLTKNIH
jgi:hypothetical protein